MEKLSKEQAIKIIEGKELISKPGKYTVKTGNVSRYTDKKNVERSVVNLRAMSPFHLEQAKADLAKGDFDSAANRGFTHNPRVGKDFTPQAGEIVNVEITEVELKEGGTGLFVDQLVERQAEKASKISLSAVAEEKLTA